MDKINKSCRNSGCCRGCDDKYRGFGSQCKHQCDYECSNCSQDKSSDEDSGYYHDGGWYND